MSLTYLQAVAFDRSIAEAHIYFAWISTEYVLVVVFTYRCAEDFFVDIEFQGPFGNVECAVGEALVDVVIIGLWVNIYMWRYNI